MTYEPFHAYNGSMLSTGAQVVPDLLLAESLCAITGLWPSSDRPSENDVIAATGYLVQMGGRFQRWLSAPDAEDYEPRPFEWVEPPSEKALQDRILKPIEGDEQARILAAPVADTITADEYLTCIQRGRDYLDSQWPKMAKPGIKAEVFPLSEEELADVWILVRVLDNPDRLLEHLEEHTLSVPIVNAWRAAYPVLSAAFDQEVERAITDRLARKKSLTWEQADLVLMLKGKPLDSIVELQESKTDKKPQPEPQP